MKVEEPIVSFTTEAAWRTWLKKHHARSTGVLLKIGKPGGPRSITYAQALDGALAWGWIDSQKRALDATAWLQRFSPRTKKSPWSKINRTRADALIAAGTMEAPGQRAIDAAKADGRWDAAYDGARTSTVPPDLEAALAKNPRAKAFFEQLDGANRYAILFRVQQPAKQPKTRADRIDRLVGMCARHEKLH